MAVTVRSRLLLTLDDGRALPATTLASEAGLPVRAVTGALPALVADGLVELVTSGPYRYHRLANPGSALAAEARRLEPGAVACSLRPGSAAYDVRLARRCFGHLAGRLGVAVTDALRGSGVIEGPSGDVDLAKVAVRGSRLAGGVIDDESYGLTPAGRARLAALGVRVPEGLGEVRCCVDWTEQRHHLAGPLGAALHARFVEADG